MRKVVALGTVAVALAVAGAAPARVATDTVKWVVASGDIGETAVVLQVQSSAPFKSLFLYPNGAFKISGVTPQTCRAVPAPQGQGVGCTLGSATSAVVRFDSTPPIPVGTSAKLVLDNADGSGARALTATLQSCAGYEENLNELIDKFVKADTDYRAALHDLVRIENAGLMLLFLGELGALTHDKAVEDFRAAQKRLAAADADVEKATKALKDCQGTSKRGLLSSGRQATCTEVEWRPLLARSAKLKLRKFAPLARKITAERKRKQKTAASHDQKRLHAQLKSETRATKGLMKAVDACK